MPKRQDDLARARACARGSGRSRGRRSAGTIVIARRRKSGIWRWRKPCITTWPASVPTDDDEMPEASSAMPKTMSAWRPTVLPSPCEDLVEILDAGQPALVEDAGGHHQHADVDRRPRSTSRSRRRRARSGRSASVPPGSRRRRGSGSAPSAGRSRAASRSHRGCRPRAGATRSRRSRGSEPARELGAGRIREEDLEREAERRSRRRARRSPPRGRGSRATAAPGSRTPRRR